jgi:uncharacterized membrane protein
MKFLSLIFVAAIFIGTSGTAQAELRLCNKTEHQQGVSVGYKSGEDWVSEGWWELPPGSCAVPITGDLASRYYYYRAEVGGGDFTGEGYFFCTSETEYTIVGDTECEERGYSREDFREIDTGATATSFTFTLTP